MSGRRLRLVLFAVAPLVVLLGALELTFRALDVGDPDARLALSRGFDPDAAYLRPHGRGWRTQMFEIESLEVVVPAKGARTRVLLLGGSNCQLLPEEVLEELLGPDEFEVVNLGRAGYGSERVAILLGQALSALRPDRVVLYAGHNEFVERGFAHELEESLGALAGVARAFARLRTVQLLADATRGTSEPEPLEQDRAFFEDFTYDRTLPVFARYEENLRAMMRATADAGVPTTLCTLVWNAYSPPFGQALDADVTPGEAETIRRHRGRANQLIPRRFLDALHPPVRLRVASWGERAVLGDRRMRPPEPRQVGELPRLREGVTPQWVEPGLWSEDVWTVLRCLERVFERELSEEERAAVSEARDELSAALAVRDGQPMVLFDLALCTWLLGIDDGQAAGYLEASARFDRAPRKANALVNDAVRRVAGDFAHVTLLDAERLFRERSPDGLVGYELLMDHCHLHPGTRRLLMRELADALVSGHRPER